MGPKFGDFSYNLPANPKTKQKIRNFYIFDPKSVCFGTIVDENGLFYGVSLIKWWKIQIAVKTLKLTI